MSEKQNSLFNGSTATIATLLAGLVSLGLIMGWKIDAANMAQAGIIKKECDDKYVTKELYYEAIGNIKDNIKAIGRAVGAPIRER